MEAVTERNLERTARIQEEAKALKTRLDLANKEMSHLRQEAMQREAYFSNFAAQLFRTVRDIGHEQWPALFGRLMGEWRRRVVVVAALAAA